MNPYEITQQRNKVVYKSNKLIQQGKFSLSAQQQKIMLYIISQIQPSDTEFKLYEFNIADFCKVCGIDSGNGNNYKGLKEQIQDICNKSRWITLDNGQETIIRWIDKPYIDKNSGKIKIKLDNDLKPYLLQLKNNFTSYELAYTLNFKSKYSIRFYEYIKSIHYHPLEEYEHVITIEEFKQRLNAEKYSNYRDVNARVITPIIREINDKSDMLVEIEPLLYGRKVAALKIKMKYKGIAEAQRARAAIEYNLNAEYRQEVKLQLEQEIENIDGQLSFDEI